MLLRQKKLAITALALIVIVLVAVTGYAAPRGGWQGGEDYYHPQRVIVRFADVVTPAEAVASMEQLGYSVLNVASFQPTRAFPSGLRLGIIELPEKTSVDQSIVQLQSLPGILYAERDYIRYKYDVPQSIPLFPNDTYFDRMWGLHNEGVTDIDPEMLGIPVDDADIDAPEAWAMHTGSGEVVVAVIDTGIYIDHPDLADHIWINEAEMGGTPGVDDDGNGYIDDFWGWNFHNGSNQVFDPTDRDRYGYLNDEHGTHVAGTIGALSDNGMGVAGINWDIQIIALKFIGGDGGYTSDAILALQYAAEKGAKVINCSWGGGGYNQSLRDTIEATGAVVVCAAGNTGDNTDIDPHYPASYDAPNIISVAAMMQNEEPVNYPGWWSTCWGPETVDLYAPGGYILSTIPPDPVPVEPTAVYAYFYGTSMASPHVAGSAALLHSLRPNLPLYRTAEMDPNELTIRDAILRSVDVKPIYQGTVSTGGRLNLANAMMQIVGPVITSINAEPSFGPPPLEVAFTAAATTAAGEIVDYWWDFGDGSDPVHEFETVHIYEELGDYNATFHVVDEEGVEATASITIRVFYPPEIEVDPTEIHTWLQWGETEDYTIEIQNVGLGELTYTAAVQLVGRMDTSGRVTPLGSGGPDEYGYFWWDSDEPGVALPEWEDISEIGTRLILGGDDSSVVDLPFEFPFYGDLKNSVRISSNGYLTFGDTGTTWSPHPIPDTREPNALIAPFWCDLEPQNDNGRVFYYGDGEKFVVQYQNVPRYSHGGAYTFQVILEPSGLITYRYEQMLGGWANDASVGIENADGTIGLQLAYKEDYVHDDMAVFFVPGWLILDKYGGVVAPQDSDLLTATFAAHNLSQGTWQATIKIMSNDPANPVVDVETFMFAKSIIPPTIRSISADPWAGSAPLTVNFSADVYDVDGEIVEVVWDFGDGSPLVRDTLAPIYTYTVEGEYTATLTITDDDGLTAEASVQIVVQDLPEVSVEPTSIRRALRAHREEWAVVTVINVGEAALEMEIEAVTTGDFADAVQPLAAGGPDGFGYLWVDSNQPGGPTFEWVEISEIGTRLPLSGDDSLVMDLPFEFPFYGDLKTEIRICSDGYLTFGTRGNVWQNSFIPNAADPNDLLAVYWDDLNPPYAPATGGVFYYYDEANERFIVEWKELPRYYQNGSYTFQAMLYADGTIVYQYKDMEFTPGYINQGTIGIENADGSDGLEVLYNQAGYVHDGLAIQFNLFTWLTVEPSTLVLEPGESAAVNVRINLGEIGTGELEGAIVMNTNDIRTPRTIVPVQVEVLPNAAPVITACGVNPQTGPMSTVFSFVGAAHDPDGQIADKWWDFGDGSDPVHAFTAEHTYAREGEYVAVFTVVDNDGYQASAQVNVTVREPASAQWQPKQLDFALGQGQTAQDTIILSNVGTGTLLFGMGETASQVPLLERIVQPADVKDPNAKTAVGLYEANLNPERSAWLPDDVGSVLDSWYVSSPVNDVWGVGTILTSNELVLGDVVVDPTVDYVVTADGTYTGRSWVANFGGSWSGDMAFDGSHIWQVNVGGDNAIYKIDPATGTVVGSISGSPWTSISQRGLAYNANDDTFYIGGWNEDIIYKIKGESWDNPGQVIESWDMPVSIAGLAYHPKADVLVVTNNASPDMIYFVDATSHAVLAQFPHPAGGEYMGVGCEFDRDGNLWVSGWGEGRMYLLETGLGAIGSDWLSWEPMEGEIPAGGSELIKVTIDAAELGAGVYTGSVVLATNDFENPLIIIPVTATIAAGPEIIEVSAAPDFGEPPLEVAFLAEYIAGDAAIIASGWDFGDGSFSSEANTTHVYTAPGVYTATFSVEDANGSTAEMSVEIEVKWLPKATIEPSVIEVTLPITGKTTKTVVLGNEDGNAALDFEVKVSSGSAPLVVLPKRIGTVSDGLASNAQGLYAAVDPELVAQLKAAVEPNAVGDVLAAWEVPLEIDTPWGVGFDTEQIWISDPAMVNDHLITTSGSHTGTVFATPWAGAWPGDMAYDSNRNLMWQVNVGGDNGIYALDVETGQVVMSITTGPWTSVSQRGLAYDAATDTFFVGGWNEDIIYHIYGPSHSNPGAVIQAYSLPVGIAGLAWHPAGMLWVSSNAAPDMIYGLDLEALEIVYQFPHPAGMDYSGAGLTVHRDGNLWASSMKDFMMYLVSTEMPLAQGIEVNPNRGTIAAGETAELEISIDAAELGKPGEVVKQHLAIKTNDPYNAYLYVDLIVNIEPGPSITEIAPESQIGEPPLNVTFAAAVEAGAAEIIDFWWDFGDGSEQVHALEAEHTYVEVGEYTAVFTVVDANGVVVTAEVDVTVKWLPVLGIYPEAFEKTIQVGEVKQDYLTVSNMGAAPMDFLITVAPSFAESPEWLEYRDSEPVKGDYASEPKGYAGAGSGGPDQFGYIWMDSKDDFGPSFDWVEISEVGTKLYLSDESVVDVALPFAFPFYGEFKTKVGIGSNGYLTFGNWTGSVWTNTPIPEPSEPNDLLAVFWDDLDPSSNGDVYFYNDQEANRFIVEYKGVSKWLGSESYSFQVILYPDGTIVYQYLTMNGDLNSATVGIENARGTDGLQVVYNAPYIEDGLAIHFSPVGSLLNVNPAAGMLVEGGSQDVVVTFGSEQAAYGQYLLNLYVAANDPFRPFAQIPVALTVNAAPQVEITAPVGGAELNGLIEITWVTADPDHEAEELVIDLAWSRDGEEWHEIAAGLANTGSFEWNCNAVGEAGDTFRLKARVTDPAGAYHEFVTAEFTIINNAPTAKFSFTPSSATRWDTVKFVDESTDDGWIAVWAWDFGDGTVSSEQNPEHIFAELGEFEVKLVVTDNGGLTAETVRTVAVVNAPPIAKFSFSPAEPGVGETISFVNESRDDGEITACFWEFGDDTTSSEWSPQHSYSAPGVYTVKLTVIDENGTAAQTEQEIEVIYVNLPPTVEVIKPLAGDVLTGKEIVQWIAVDPDDEAESLKITLQYKGADSDEWQLIATNLANTGEYLWDSSQVPQGGRYQLQVTAADPDGATGSATSLEFVVAKLSRTVVAAPNPTSAAVTFYYDLPEDGTLYVYTVAGKLVYTAELAAALNAHDWNLEANGRPLANGIYLYFVVSGGERSELGRLVVNR